MNIENGRRILVVEDEAAVCMMIEDMVLDFGCEVVGPAATFDQAMHLARQEEFDAAVLDIRIGQNAVYPIADLMRSRGIPFLFSTGYGSEVVPERFRDVAVLNKPFAFNCLAGILRAVLSEPSLSRRGFLAPAMACSTGLQSQG
jgi:DNA-binding response OmpR family regulator